MFSKFLQLFCLFYLNGVLESSLFTLISHLILFKSFQEFLTSVLDRYRIIVGVVFFLFHRSSLDTDLHFTSKLRLHQFIFTVYHKRLWLIELFSILPNLSSKRTLSLLRCVLWLWVIVSTLGNLERCCLAWRKNFVF